MKKCPNCGTEFVQDMSFCPKCGTVFRGTTTRRGSTNPNNSKTTIERSQNAEKSYKSRPVWFYVLAVVFFPISLTVIVVRSTKYKLPVKIALIVGIWLLALILPRISGRNDAPAEANMQEDNIIDESTTMAGEEEESTELTVDDEDKNRDETKEEVVYHRNKGVNKAITLYNAVSEYPVSPDIIGVSNGGNTGTFHYEDGPMIEITCNDSGVLLIRMEDEALSNGQIFYVFADMCKALDETLDDAEIDQAMKEIATEKYNYYGPYMLHELKCSYLADQLVDGTGKLTDQNRYKIWLDLDHFE